jgi:Na+/H+-dicarboxylate symporter
MLALELSTCSSSSATLPTTMDSLKQALPVIKTQSPFAVVREDP